jgi:hypothetical protein
VLYKANVDDHGKYSEVKRFLDLGLIAFLFKVIDDPVTLSVNEALKASDNKKFKAMIKDVREYTD